MNYELAKAMATNGRAIPGQSLTNDPANPAPFEKPPKFTTIHDAAEEIFENLSDEETLPGIVEALDDQIPIMDITQAILFKGFTDGKWNGDLMMLLIEPVAYMLLAIAERMEIEAVIYRGEEEDEEVTPEVEALGLKMKEDKVNKLRKYREMGKVPAGILEPELLRQIQTLPEPEPAVEETPAPVEAPSLMAKPQEVQQ